MCPYARFQSAMFDKDTLVITYDQARGEPRGSRSRKADPAKLGLGSCVDCGLCVQVCPTGIDIRKGLQYDCIGCAACVDVCDGIMDKMGYAKGLVRYATENGVDQHLDRHQMLQRVMRPRVLIYTGILIVICAAFIASLMLRDPFRVDVVRDRASLARIVDDGMVENVYRLQIMNNAEQPQRYRLAVSGLQGLTIAGTAEAEVGPADARWLTVAVRLPPEIAQQAGSGAHTIHFEVLRTAHDGLEEARVDEKSTFLVPR
jgi:cytochrome c oxidase accessory protein FixG